MGSSTAKIVKLQRSVLLSLMIFAFVSTFGIAAGQQKESDESYSVTITTQKVATLGTSLDNWCGVTFEFLPDGRIMCGELRGGAVRMIVNNTLQPDPPLLELDIFRGYKDQGVIDEQGLLGLALDPNFDENQYVYLHWTYVVDSATNQTARQVARFTLDGDHLTDKLVLIDGIPAAKQHVGGPLEFGPDGKLYITGGEAGMQKLAQEMGSPLGKILRINPDGTIPDDNPFPNQPYYTIGHRNSFGIGFHPVTGVPYITENGPATNDEVNILYAGKNYGWPAALGSSDDPRFISPLYDTGTGTIAPTELEFYTGDKYPKELVNDLFFLAYNTRSLERIELEEPGYDKVAAHHSYELPPTGQGSYTDIELGPDGYFYVSDFKSISRVMFDYSNVATNIEIDQLPSTSPGTATTITAKLLDGFDNPVVNVPVSFFASGTAIGAASTNQEGIARLVYTPLSGGEFSITAKFDGNQQHRASASEGVTLVVEGSSVHPPQIMEAMAQNNLLVRVIVIPTGEQNDNSSIRFSVKFVDPRTEVELDNIPYLVEITRENTILFSQRAVSGKTVPLHEHIFEELGPAEIAVNEINNSDSSVRFSVNIVPEFPLLFLVPAFAFALAISVLLYGRLRSGRASI